MKLASLVATVEFHMNLELPVPTLRYTWPNMAFYAYQHYRAPHMKGMMTLIHDLDLLHEQLKQRLTEIWSQWSGVHADCCRMETPSPGLCTCRGTSFWTSQAARYSGSSVLTATGFVNGKWQFSTPCRIDTPQPITKQFVTDDYVGDPYGCAKLSAYPSTRGFWAHGWNITKVICIYAPIYGNSPTGQTRRRIFTRDGSSDVDSRKDVPFWDFFILLPIQGVKNPKSPNFGAWIGIFKPNSRNRKTCILSKLLHRFQPNFAQW